MNKKDYKSSQSEFEKVITRYPESHLVPMAKMEMAVAYENSNDFAKAKEIYEGIIKVYPDSTWNQEAQARLIALSGMAQTAVKK
jgi:TolA-binding protein